LVRVTLKWVVRFAGHLLLRIPKPLGVFVLLRRPQPLSVGGPTYPLWHGIGWVWRGCSRFLETMAAMLGAQSATQSTIFRIGWGSDAMAALDGRLRVFG
jgi:hypothetical protein